MEANKIGIKTGPGDNVVTVVEDVCPGETVQYMTTDGPRHVTALQVVSLGHKVALKNIEPGEKITKYEQTIGTASKRIEEGEHVHVHNVRSAVEGRRK